MLTVLRCDLDGFAGQSTLRVSTGRSAIHHLVRAFNPSAVIMPSFVPEGITMPVQAAHKPILWYPLDADLTPNLDTFQETLVHAGPKPLVVVIHYFGYPTPIEELKKLVAAEGGLLFEDGAHCMPGTVIEPISDVFLWSLNKVLPTVDGAIMVSRRGTIMLESPALESPDTSALHAYAHHLRRNRDLVCTRGDQASRAWCMSSGAYEKYYSEMRHDFKLRRISEYSESVLATADLPAITTARRNNAAIIHAHLGRWAHRPWERKIVPFAFPVMVPKNKKVADVADDLWQEDVHVARMEEKWGVNTDSRYEAEAHFFDRHILLPVNERITPLEIARMCAKVNRVMQ